MAERVLVIGYGNPGRLDDGLGPAFAEAIERLELPGVRVEADYQLTVEDAALAAEADVVVFADASVDARPPFELKRIEPAADITFSTHEIAPEGVLGLAADLFGASPKGYALAIRGYAFNEFGERLSDGALSNLAAAVNGMTPALESGSLDRCANETDTMVRNERGRS